MTAAQSYRERPPVRQLSSHVTCVWVQRIAPDAVPYRHRTIPNGSAELICELGGVPRLVGPQTGPTEDVMTPGTVVVGVRLRPGAAPSVLGMPASELVDATLASNELWGPAAEQLAEQIAAAGSPGDAAATLERAIAARLAEASGPDPIATEAVRLLLPWRTDEVTSLTSALYISERQLRRRFQAATGLAPKVLQRMLRFQGFLALAQGREHPSAELARLAAEAGYADQSHLTRESLRLAGRTPRAVLLEAEEHCAGIHDHTASYGPLLASRGAAAA
jgi:AraC-like DNA-binding protein